VTERVLVIDDDPLLLQLMMESLKHDNYEVDLAPNGIEGMRLLKEKKHHLIILDIMLPDMDGWEVCHRIRQVSMIPIIMLTALGSRSDIVRGLQAGADDYLVKPFHKDELLARVSAVLRRVNMPPPSPEVPLRFGNGQLVIDPTDRLVTVNGEPVVLTPTEFELLLFMVHRPGRILSTELIFENVWSYDADANIESVKWYIWRLRKKVEKDPGKPKYIVTERGIGYRFVPNYSAGEAPAQED
jgi:DNA-binding response OmpR family regulator